MVTTFDDLFSKHNIPFPAKWHRIELKNYYKKSRRLENFKNFKNILSLVMYM